jgi:hypothetical protein
MHEHATDREIQLAALVSDVPNDSAISGEVKAEPRCIPMSGVRCCTGNGTEVTEPRPPLPSFR